jgi:hypothetical protein
MQKAESRKQKAESIKQKQKTRHPESFFQRQSTKDDLCGNAQF